MIACYWIQSLASSRQRNEEREQQQLELLYPDSNSVESSSAKISQGETVNTLIIIVVINIVARGNVCFFTSSSS